LTYTPPRDRGSRLVHFSLIKRGIFQKRAPWFVLGATAAAEAGARWPDANTDHFERFHQKVFMATKNRRC
jgi:hypothetical protein